jgi:Xaa-Pro aminopeptidase
MSAARADRLVEKLAERELDALLVTNLVNVRYLTGFTGTNGVCVVGPQERAFLTDFRYVERAKIEVPDFERLRGKQELLADAAERLSGRVGFEDQHMSVRQHTRLGELVGDGVELVPAGGVVEELRAVKEEGELRAIREAADLADDMYEYLCSRGLVGRTEREVALDLEREMRERGAEDPSFPSIVASGPHGALPHADPRPERIAANTLVIVDMGCRVNGYCSDCTRTFATGEIEDEAGAVYELVLAAQQESLAAVRAGAECRAVDEVARSRISEAGQGDNFGHGLGHGVGLEIHEAPRLAQTADGTLAAGNVVTVEPGVYLPGAFGVRIEDLVIVSDGGSEVLSHFPKSLITLGA